MIPQPHDFRQGKHIAQADTSDRVNGVRTEEGLDFVALVRIPPVVPGDVIVQGLAVLPHGEAAHHLPRNADGPHRVGRDILQKFSAVYAKGVPPCRGWLGGTVARNNIWRVIDSAGADRFRFGGGIGGKEDFT